MISARGGTNHQSGLVMASILTYLTKAQLAKVAFELFAADGSHQEVGVRKKDLTQFIALVGSKYHDNPYHNFHHAVDTTRTMAWMLGCSVFRTNFTPERRFILLLASLIHDIGHPGHNNQFEIKTNTELAQKYENLAVLEHHSLDIAFKLLEDPGCRLLEGLAPASQESSRQLLREMVLATDFDFHPNFMAGFIDFIDKTPQDFSNPEYISWVSRALIKAADIANTTKPFEEAKRWGRRVMMEFWAQGVEEKLRHLTVGPINDPHAIHVNETQANFIRFGAMGLFETLTRIEPAFSPLIVNLKENLRRYQEMDRRGASLFD